MTDEASNQTISENVTEDENGASTEGGESVVAEEKPLEDGVGEDNATEEVPLSQLEPKDPQSPIGNIDFILEVPLKVTVNLGSCKILVKELLQLGQGSVVELDKMAGETMDVLIGDRLIARGEVVVVNEKFGVRLTDIVSTTERINQLKD
ncbi:MAG: flagellar motor switch protein FliN [Nitrospiria bacterium]